MAAAPRARRRARPVRPRGGDCASRARRSGRCGGPLSRRRCREARRPRRRTPTRNGGGGVARGSGTGREEPGRAGRVGARRRRALARHPGLERGRARLPAATRRLTPHRCHRHEREDDDDRITRRDPPLRRPDRRGCRQRRPGAHRRRAHRGGGLVDRVRAFELPARGRPHARLRRRRPPQPRARPPRPARQLRRVPRREAPHL